MRRRKDFKDNDDDEQFESDEFNATSENEPQRNDFTLLRLPNLCLIRKLTRNEIDLKCKGSFKMF